LAGYEKFTGQLITLILFWRKSIVLTNICAKNDLHIFVSSDLDRIWIQNSWRQSK